MNTKTGVFVKRLVAMALVVAMACPYAYAADIGKVTYVEGRVDVSKQGSDVATPLREGDAIAIGDAIRTKSNSKAEVTFNDKTAMRLSQNTKVEVKNYVLDADNKRKTAEVMVDRGRIRTIIEKMPGLTEFNISTPNAKGTVHGSDVYTSFQAGSSNMLVAEGSLSVMNPSIPKDVLIIPAGNSVLVPQNEIPQGPRAYFELEKKMQEQDTSIPETVSRDPNSTVIKGAIARMSGDVRVKFKNADKIQKATVNDILGEGDTIQTGADGLVEIKFENGNGLNLKPDTQVTITKLAQDPKTGRYENKFDASMGKVRARIEKLKETKSTFEVRTPTAICGARGTLMYIEIGPKVTRCFFEGGLGNLASAISSMHREIELGHASYADVDGNVYEEYIPSDGERLNWTMYWDPGNGTEGYASPGGTVYITNGSVGGNIPGTGTEFQDFFSDPLFEIGVTEEPLTSSGSFYGDTSHYDGREMGNIEGIIGVTKTFWNGGTANLVSTGECTSDMQEPFIWFGAQNFAKIEEGKTINEGYLYSYDSDADKYMTYDGGAFYGNAVGIGGGGIMDGFIKVLYIDPSGKAGIAGGIVEGLASDGAYIFAGDITSEFELTDTWTDTVPSEYTDWIYITPSAAGHLHEDFSKKDYIDGYDYLYTISMVNRTDNVAEQWGIYYQRYYSGTYNGTISDGWTAKMGGDGTFGAYYSSENFMDDGGYWSADITEGTWADSKLTAALTGKFLTHTKTGDMSGELIGTYNENDESWQGVGIGTWGTEESTPLMFVSDVSADLGTYSDMNGGFSTDSGITGILGGTTSLWDALENAVKFIGVMAPDGLVHTWSGELKSSNYLDSTRADTTYDENPGAYYGFVEGIHNNSSVEGRMLALYIGPQVDGVSNTGYLKGSLDGTYYEGAGLIDASGTLTRNEVTGATVTIDPNDLYSNATYRGNISARISGLFDGTENTFDGEEISATPDTTLFIIDYSTRTVQNWGIFDLPKIGGTSGSIGSWSSAAIGGEGDFGAYYAEGSESPSADSGYWAAFDMEGSWEGSINSKFTGTFLTHTKTGDITGELLGTDNEDGSWQGIGIGTWGTEESTPLKFASDVSSSISGILGGVYSLWSGAADIPVLFIGNSGLFDIGVVSLVRGISAGWNSEVSSQNYYNGTNTTYDDNPGSYRGFLAGVQIGTKSIAKFIALYISPSIEGSSRVGVLSGDLDGSYNQGAGVIEMNGYLNLEDKGATDIRPEDLYNSTSQSIGTGKLSGNFDDGGTLSADEDLYTISIVDGGVAYGWGVYSQNIGGLYSVESSGIWNGKIGGNDDIGAYVTSDGVIEGDNAYWIADVGGDAWDKGSMAATLNGNYLSRYRIGTMNGTISGLYDESGSWEGVGSGEWQGDRLDFVSDISGTGSDDNSVNAYLGGTENIWSNGTVINVIGQTIVDASDKVTWGSNGSFMSHNYYTGYDTTYGLESGFAGAYEGQIKGIRTADSMRALFGAIYIDDSGNAGVITSNLSGNYFSSIGMFDMSGSIGNPLPSESTSILPNDLGDNIISAGAGSMLTGNSLDTMRICSFDNSIIYDWGIYTQRISGSGLGSGPSWNTMVGGDDFALCPENMIVAIGNWIAELNGSIDALGGTLDGSIAGHFITNYEMGHLSGDILGIHSAGDWVAVGVGSWTSDPLKFVSNVVLRDYNTGIGFDAMMGGIKTLWSGSPTLSMIGKMDASETPRIWYSDTIQSHDYYNDTNTTYDGGAYYGFMAGTESAGAMNGKFAALYIGPGHNAGVLTSDLTGTFYPDIGMFEMLDSNNNITKTQYATSGNVGVNPEELGVTTVYITEGSDSYSVDSLNDVIAAGYNLRTYSIVNDTTGIAQKWGIFTLSVEGDYSGAFLEASLWNTVIGGYNAFGTYNYSSGIDDEGYWIGHINGDVGSWSGGTLEGTLSGRFMTHYKMGSVDGSVFGTYSGDSWNAEGIGTWNGSALKFVSDVEGYDYEGGSFYALMGGTKTLWSGSPTLSIIGEMDASLMPRIWYSDTIQSQNYNNYTTTTYDGGAYYGFMTGTESGGAMNGKFAALYIAPNGNAGVLTSDLTGTFYPDIGMFEMLDSDNDIIKTQYATSGNVGVDPVGLGDAVYPTYGSDDYSIESSTGYENNITGWYDLSTYSIINYAAGIAQKWGIYTQSIWGNYLTEPLDTETWNTVIGGYDVFGAYYSSGDEYMYDDDGYWIGHINGDVGSWSGGTLEGTLSGRFMTHYKMGSVDGSVFGTYSGDSWNAEGIGTWNGSALKFVSDFSGADYEERSFYALMGGTKTLWSGSPTLSIIGEMDASLMPRIWYSDTIQSQNYNNYTTTTYDGGAYYGFMRGTESGGAMNGKFAALYIAPNGNAGVLTSDLTGTFYPDIGMFEMLDSDNNITKTQYATSGNVGVNPEELGVTTVYITETDNGVDSLTMNENNITGWYDLSTYSIINYAAGIAQKWGIYTQSIWGNYLTEPLDTETWNTVIGGYDVFGAYYSSGDEYMYDDDGYWIGHINGDVGSWSGGTLEGTLSGRFMTHHKMGSVDGSVFGTYSDDSWDAAGIGTWNGSALKFVSDVSGGDYEGRSFYALMGGTKTLWSGSPTLSIIGEMDASLMPRIWYSDPVQSYNYNNYTYTTYDNGAYYGFMAGTESSGAMNGKFAALYIAPNGNAGVLTSDITGTFYPDIGMFESLDRDVVKTEYAISSDVKVQAKNLGSAVYATDSDGSILAGSFQSGGGYVYSGSNDLYIYSIVKYTAGIVQNWGIYTQSISGSYLNSDSDTSWNAVVGGNDIFGVHNSYVTTYGQRDLYKASVYDGYSLYDYSIPKNSGIVHYYDSLGIEESYKKYNADGSIEFYVWDAGAGQWKLDKTGSWDPAIQSLGNLVKANPPSHTSVPNYEDHYNGADSDSGYWVAFINDGSWNADGTLDGELSGKFITRSKVGNITGGVFGTYDAGLWGAEGVGSWAGTPLSWSASTDDGSVAFGYFDTEDGLQITSDAGNYIYSIFGGTDNLFNGRTNQMTLIGEFSNTGEHKLWGGLTGGSSADENSAFGGMIGGIVDGTKLRGMFSGLFVTPDGSGGYLAGYTLSNDISADIYGGLNSGLDQDSGVILGKGWLTSYIVGPTDFTPADFEGGPEDINFASFSSDIRPGGNMDGSVIGQLANIPEQDWCLFFAGLGGSYSEPESTFIFNIGADNSGYYWVGICAGVVDSLTGVMRGATRNIALDLNYGSTAMLSGNILGLAYTDNSWEAIALGVGRYMGSTDIVPTDFDDFVSHYLSIEDIVGSNITMNISGGLNAMTVSGSSINIIDQNWGILGLEFTGSYNPSGTSVGKLVVGGIQENPTDPAYYWMGVLAYSKDGASNSLTGKTAGIWLSPSAGYAGLMSIDIFGVVDEASLSWSGVGIGDWTVKDDSGIVPIDFEDFRNYLVETTFTGCDDLVKGNGDFNGMGSITATSIEGEFIRLSDQNWGVWGADMAGDYVKPATADSVFKLAAAGEASDGTMWVGTTTGTLDEGLVNGQFDGVTVRALDGDAVAIGIMKGSAVGGYVEDGETTGTWNAAAAGEWVEVSELLDQTAIFAGGLSELQSFVNVPITQVYSNLLTAGPGACTNGINSAVMNINLYAVDVTSLNGIWAALISGTYGTVTSPNWTANVTNGAGNDVTLTGRVWDTDKNQWAADVSGTVGGNDITEGQAGGTFGNGEFTGAGVGTWEAPK